MRYVRNLAAGLLAVTLLASAAQAAGDKVTLKLNLAKGDVVSTVQEVDMTTEIVMGDQKVTMAMKIGMDISMAAQEVDADGLHTIKYTYDGMRVKITGGPMAIDFDSAKGKPSDPMSKVFAAMVGQSITAKVTREGKVKELVGIEEMVAKVSKESGLPAAAARQQADSMKQSLEQAFAYYPAKPVGVGDAWEGKLEMAGGMGGQPMVINTNYTMQERKDGQATIKADGKLKSEGDGGLAGTMAGVVKLDEKTGVAKSGDMEMKFSGNVGGTEMTMAGTIKFTTK